MSLLEYIESFENNLFANVKEMTEKFNELKFNERKVFLNNIKNKDQTIYDNFIEQIRNQAVEDFWTAERELILLEKARFELEGQYVQMNISYWQLMMICK